MEEKKAVEAFNLISKQSLIENLGIEFTEVGPDYVKGKMPVDERTVQPMGLLHGGASAALAETLGSMGAILKIDQATQVPVGLEINANHLRGVRSGFVYGTARPLHLGRQTHVWEIKITDEDDKLVCVSRLTLMILDKSSA